MEKPFVNNDLDLFIKIGLVRMSVPETILDPQTGLFKLSVLPVLKEIKNGNMKHIDTLLKKGVTFDDGGDAA